MSSEAPLHSQAEHDPALQIAMDCYLSAIQSIAETIANTYPEIGSPYYEQLIRLRRRLAFEANATTLAESRVALQRELEGFSARARRYNRALAEDVTQTLAILAKNEGAQTVQNTTHLEHLANFADDMDRISGSGDLQALARKSGELRAFVESMEQDSRAALTRLQQSLGEFQNKLREAELLASIDALTGAGNRREFDRQIASRITANREFCVLLFDVDNFKAINDQYGHLCGDEILKQLSARLMGQVRTRDFVCRWGGDEFVAILECGMASGFSRSRQMAQWLSGPYRVSVEGREVRVDVAVSVGIAERLTDETPEQLFQRVDASMYGQKNF